MTSTRKLLLVITKHTIHTKSTFNHTIITRSIKIETIQSINIPSNHVQQSSFATSVIPTYSTTDDDKGHSITSILSGCKTLKDCYNRMIDAQEYISLLKQNDSSSYSLSDHKYFLYMLISRASKDKYLNWQTIFKIIEFYSNMHERNQMPIDCIQNFLSLLSKRGDYDGVSCIIERLISEKTSKLPTISTTNAQIFTLLIQALRIGGHSERGYTLYEQAMNEFNLQPSITLLLQGYMV